MIAWMIGTHAHLYALLSFGNTQEGYRVDSRGEIPSGWINNGLKGVDAVAHISNPNIDYQTLHFYGESFSIALWNWTSFFTYYAANRANMAHRCVVPGMLNTVHHVLTIHNTRWFPTCTPPPTATSMHINSMHIYSCTHPPTHRPPTLVHTSPHTPPPRYNKPIVLEEIGILTDSLPMTRDAFLSNVFNTANYAGYAGVLVWQVAPDGAVLPSGLDFSYSQDGGQAMQAQLDWAASANSGENPPVAFSADPPCEDFPPPGAASASACMVEVGK